MRLTRACACLTFSGAHGGRYLQFILITGARSAVIICTSRKRRGQLSFILGRLIPALESTNLQKIPCNLKRRPTTEPVMLPDAAYAECRSVVLGPHLDGPLDHSQARLPRLGVDVECVSFLGG